MMRIVQWVLAAAVFVLFCLIGWAVVRENWRTVGETPPIPPSPQPVTVLRPSVATSAPANARIEKAPVGAANRAASTEAAAADAAPPPKPAVPRKGNLTWPQVEERMEKIRSGRKDNPVLAFDLSEVYDYVADPAFTDSADYPAHCAELGKWRDELPQSPTSLVVLGKAHIQYAWEARGSGYAGTVTEEGWQKFHTRLGEARSLLERAVKLGPADGEAHRQLLVVAMAEGLSDEETRVWFDAGRRLDPAYVPLYRQMAITKMPRWGGEPGDVERFAAEVASLVPGDDGLELFAHIAEEIHGYECDDPTTILWGEYDRELLAKAADVLVKRYPKWQKGVQFAALCSLVCNDHELARRIRPLVGEFDPAHRVWIWKNSHGEFIRWAEATEIPSGEERELRVGLAGCIAVAFAKDPRYLWTGQQFGRRSVVLFDTTSGKIRLELPHPGGVVNHTVFDNERKRVLLAAWNGPLVGWMLFDFASREEPIIFPVTSNRIEEIALHPKQNQVAWTEAKKLRLLDLDAEDPQPRDVEISDPFGLRYSPDGKRLTVGRCIFDPATGEKVLTLPFLSQANPRPPINVNEVLAIDDDGRIWTIASRLEKQLRQRDVVRFSADGQQTETLLPDLGQGKAVLSPDRRLLAVARETNPNSGPCSIDIFDVAQAKRVKQLGGHWTPIGDMAFSADSRKLATVPRTSDAAKIWSLEDVAGPQAAKTE